MTRIDLKRDPRVFAVLDDGCNCKCHTPAFIDHMRAVLESEGKELSPLVGEAKHYTGTLEDAEPQVDETFPLDWRFLMVLRCVQF